jgi:hypothetical protein
MIAAGCCPLFSAEFRSSLHAFTTLSMLAGNVHCMHDAALNNGREAPAGGPACICTAFTPGGSLLTCKMSTAPSMHSKQVSSRTRPLQAKLGMHAKLSPPTAMRHPDT